MGSRISSSRRTIIVRICTSPLVGKSCLGVFLLLLALLSPVDAINGVSDGTAGITESQHYYFFNKKTSTELDTQTDFITGSIDDTDQLKRIVMQGLGLTRIPDNAKVYFLVIWHVYYKCFIMLCKCTKQCVQIIVYALCINYIYDEQFILSNIYNV